MKKFCSVILFAICFGTPDIYAMTGTTCDNFEITCGDTIKVKTKKAPRVKKTVTVKNYSRYRDIYELIRGEFITLRVSGSSVNNVKTSTMSLTMQVLYVVDGVVVSDNGVLEIRLRTK